MSDLSAEKGTFFDRIGQAWQDSVDVALQVSAEIGISPLVQLTFPAATPYARTEALLSAVWGQHTRCQDLMLAQTTPDQFENNGFYRRALELVAKRGGENCLGAHLTCARH